MHSVCKAAAYLGLHCEKHNENKMEVQQAFIEHVAKFGLSYGT